MLKLVRNCFGEKKLLKDNNNGIINYAFIELLYELQSREGIHAASKLKKHYIEWKQQKMKVKLAAQTLSQSVADALDFCANKLKLKEFQDCGPTINFIQLIDRSFDLLNSQNFIGKNYKAPISLSNLEHCTNFVNMVCQYLSTLTDIADNLIYKTNQKTGFIGFMFSLQSVIQLSRYLILTPESQFKFLLTCKLSQNHIEMFFSAVRSQGGFNNNPSAKQFMTTYRRLLVHHSLQNIKTGNCLAQNATEILSVTKGIVNHQECKLNDNDSTVFIANENITPVSIMEPSQLSEYSEEVVKYIGGFVSRKLKRSIKCKACTASLTDDNSQSLLVDQKSRGVLLHPSKDVIVICSFVEKFIRHSIPDKSKIKELQLFMESIPRLKLTLRRYLFSKAIFKGLTSHIQLTYVSSCVTIYIQGTQVRNKLTKLVLFKNQC
ncbi:uncharacterized protein LOC136074451 [Hydra vulgaris]|uniref:Uncharacterized protein LOC136074451 n=1 Tax=Hydra vulgaris TaxID=6087 RepID=A0ABM4B219_HYDVU